MPDPTNDIDALIEFLATASQVPFYYTATHNAENYHAALTALVADRDALKQRVEYMKALNTAAASIICERDALQQRVAELEAQPPASDLRERLVESALQGSGCRLGIMKESDAEELGRQAAWIVNGALAAMRKGDTNA